MTEIQIHNKKELHTFCTEALHEWGEQRMRERQEEKEKLLADERLCKLRKQIYREKILSIPREYMIFYDMKTTGLDPDTDQIIQFSACDGKGRVLIDTYIHPTEDAFKKIMEGFGGAKLFDEKDAEAIRMLMESPSKEDALADIQDQFCQSRLCAGYGNSYFDDHFLEKSGILFDENSQLRIDLKAEFDYFSRFHTMKKGYFRNFLISHTLESAAAYFSYDWEGNPGCPHSTLENAFATLFIFNCFLSEPTEEETHVENGSCLE